jgi:hypothetical protein
MDRNLARCFDATALAEALQKILSAPSELSLQTTSNPELVVSVITPLYLSNGIPNGRFA